MTDVSLEENKEKEAKTEEKGMKGGRCLNAEKTKTNDISDLVLQEESKLTVFERENKNY